MSEFKFSCPACDQHILVDQGYVGVSINCPSCQKLIVVPAVPGAAAPPPPAAPAVLGIQRPSAPAADAPPPPAPVTAAPRTAAYRTAPLPAQKSGSGAMKKVLVVSAVIVALALLGVGGWFAYSKFKGGEAKKGNPAAQVAAPTSAATIQALSILTKVHAAYTNITAMKADQTVTLFLNLSNITTADVNPDQPADARNAKKHPQNTPWVITNTTELTVRRAQPDWYYIALEAVSKIDRQALTNTVAVWSAGKGQFMFMDSHQRGAQPTYQQIAPSNAPAGGSDQVKGMQQSIQNLFSDPSNLAKIIKDLGQTDDESVNGQACSTLTAKVLGQKVKIWVDKSTYLIAQWQITLGGTISDADVDDVFSLVGAVVTNLPPQQLEMIKPQVKKMTPVMTKVRGTITSTTKNAELNPALTADDFNYTVPRGVRLAALPTATAAMPAANTTTATAAQIRWRNACINNLRQIDAAKQQFALEQRKKVGDPVTEADIKSYIKLDATGNLPKCPAGGKYVIGKVGEIPTCSIDGHVLP